MKDVRYALTRFLSYLICHEGINQRWHIEISLEFATIHPDGVLVYVGRYGHENDSMALELRDGKLYYVFSAGDDVQTVSVGPDKGESIVNGKWQKVTISFQQRVRLGHLQTSKFSVTRFYVANFICSSVRATLPVA